MSNGLEIAIIGMSGRFPDAPSVEKFWENIMAGKDCINYFSVEEAIATGVPESIARNPNYIRAKGVLDDVESFDIGFFNTSPKEAELLDPQIRIFQECAWEALEDSGYVPDKYSGLIGVYSGGAPNFSWWQLNMAKNKMKTFAEAYQFGVLNERDFLSTKVSYKLNLKGPSFTVQTGCSTSLVSIHLACQGLLSGDCDMALAGGVSVSFPQKNGYIFQEGLIFAQDGKCKSFDSRADGTVIGDGAGIVVLKRLEDAVKDRDHIYAVIKATAINNDGSRKVGFVAPSIEGQIDVLKSAYTLADIDTENISYIEAHGTGTPMGDPIELEALKAAFNTDKKKFCRIGSVKSNIGHLNSAAGVAGVIKTALAIENRVIPPTINYLNPNPKIDFENSPFIVNDSLHNWNSVDGKLLAGVNSFGMGGTNAHAVLENGPEINSSENNGKARLIILSADTKNSLDRMTEKIETHLLNNRDINIGDMSFTLQNGRKEFKFRRSFAGRNTEELISKIKNRDYKDGTVTRNNLNKTVVFMFTGQGSQYMNMGIGIYKTEEVFRNELDKCFKILTSINGKDYKSIIFSDKDNTALLKQTEITQPILFSFEYALAKYLISKGIKPDAMIGHSLGEYVAACISGVLNLEDALNIIVKRGQLITKLSSGFMVSINKPENEIKDILGEKLSLAASNSSEFCVVAGEPKEIENFEAILTERGITFQRLHTSHAFHSYMMEPILPEFEELFDYIKINKPGIPYVSNVTGTFIKEEDLKDKRYWSKHMRGTVKFSDGIAKLLEEENIIFIEVGPGYTLSTFARQHKNKKQNHAIVETVRHFKNECDDMVYMLEKFGNMWLSGVNLNWSSFYTGEERKRVKLPTYSFEKYKFNVTGEVFLGDNYESFFRGSVVEDINENDNYLLQSESSDYIEPKTDEEWTIQKAWIDTLGIEKISTNSDFFEIGGDSLKVVNLKSKLQNGFDVTLNDLFEFPTIERQAENLRKKTKTFIQKLEDIRKLGYERMGNEIYEKVYADIKFKEEIKNYKEKNAKYEKMDKFTSTKFENILLTGSTGYLGIHLLRALFLNTESNLYLIVRSPDVEAADTRVRNNYNHYFNDGLYDIYRARIFYICGEITQEKFGLTDTLYNELAEKINSVIHSAALVSHFGNYSDFDKINVLSTKYIVDFAKTAINKEINYISTTAVAIGDMENSSYLVYSEYDYDKGQVIPNHYGKSKFEAEKVVINARSENINTKIFRVGNVMPDSKTGFYQKNIEQNAIFSSIKSFTKLGVIPQFRNDFDFTFIDYVTDSIILLFDKAELKNEIFHIYNSKYTSISDIISMDDAGLNVKKVSIDEFFEFIKENYQKEEYSTHIENVLSHFVGWFDEKNENSGRTITHMVSEKTDMILQKLGFEWSAVEPVHIKKMVEHCRKVKFFD